MWHFTIHGYAVKLTALKFFSDSDLKNIAEFCPSLCYLNLKGCTTVTDDGISVVILKCVMLHSILACDTSLGKKSVRALCSGVPDLNDPATLQVKSPSHTLAPKLQTLDIGGCMGKQVNSVEFLRSKVLPTYSPPSNEF